jgi:hypothetical protein
LGNLKGRDRSGDIGVSGRVILESIYGTNVGGFGLGASDSGQGPVLGSCEDGKYRSYSIKGAEFVE